MATLIDDRALLTVARPTWPLAFVLACTPSAPRTWTKHATGDGYHGALSVAPHEVLLSTIDGQYHWACLRPREPAREP